jgi:hypothetical protein
VHPREQSFSVIGEHAQCGAEVWGALAHREAWAPQRDAGWAYKFKHLNMKTSLKLKINPIPEYLRLIIYPIKPGAVYYHHAGANCSVENPPPRGNKGLKRTRADATFKKID